MKDELKVLFQQMADLTAPQCAGTAVGGCKFPHSCCSSEYCEMAIEIAKEEGITLEIQTHDPKLPLMGPNGCIAPPYVRPLCTLHVCSINGLGFNIKDPKWTVKYFKLRNKIENFRIKRKTSPI